MTPFTHRSSLRKRLIDSPTGEHPQDPPIERKDK